MLLTIAQWLTGITLLLAVLTAIPTSMRNALAKAAFAGVLGVAECLFGDTVP
jgi:hypothetical protein